MAKKQVEAMHTSHGWQYGKVNRIINQVNDISMGEKVSFVEELVVLNWFNAQLVYNMGKHASKDLLEETFPKQQQSSSTAGIA